ncbi:restriction endonuclease subunit S [Flavobacteriaceae bacterium GSB9]|nr:restriction endonuclease subunit S [Flavobacteriaceae bacterium GSB9]
MIKRIYEIADIQFGLYKKAKSKGKQKYLLSSHFDDNFQPSDFDDSYVDIADDMSKFLLGPNDVILAGKGNRIFAWAYDPSFGPTVPSSLFFIIRTNPKEILGQYLAEYLNSDSVQYRLMNIGAGASITSIPKKELEQIEVVIPSIKQQNDISKLTDLMQKELELSEKLIELKATLKRGLINRMINNTKK